MLKQFVGALAIAGVASAQSIPMPTFGSTYTAAITHGFLFQAPVAFTITGVEVFNEQSQPNQVVEIIDFGSAPPPVWPGTAYGTRLHYDNTTPSGNVVSMVVPISAGNHIGILCACTPSPMSTASFNSHAAQSGAYSTNLFGNPLTLVRIGTHEGIAATNAMRPCWLSPSDSIARAVVHVQTGGSFATKVPFGTGCNLDPSESFYEVFDASNAFDVSHTTLAATYTGNGYVVQPSNNNWHTPQASHGFGDDQVRAWTLPFPIPFPGGTTSVLYVSSNGFVYLQPDGNHGCCAGNVASLLGRGTPQWAALWNDLNPTASGAGVFLDTDTVGGVAYVTFDQVPRFGTQNPNTFQYAFHTNGDVELRYQAGAIQIGTTVVGFSPGGVSLDPGPVDISATPVIATQPDSYPLAVYANARPVIGTTIDLTIAGIPGSSTLTALLFGLTRFDPGVDLSAIGMPGCFRYCSVDALVTAIASGSLQRPLSIPNDPGLAGIHIVIQGAAFNPAVIRNPLGAASSFGIDLGIDLN